MSVWAAVGMTQAVDEVDKSTVPLLVIIVGKNVTILERKERKTSPLQRGDSAALQRSYLHGKSVQSHSRFIDEL